MDVRLIAYTQYSENYGSSAVPYWKNKGGSEYLIALLTIEEASRGQEYLQDLVNIAAPKIEGQWSPGYSEERVLGWSLYFGDELTEDEKSDAEYGEGSYEVSEEFLVYENGSYIRDEVEPDFIDEPSSFLEYDLPDWHYL
jgi:hypothetical protein